MFYTLCIGTSWLKSSYSDGSPLKFMRILWEKKAITSAAFPPFLVRPILSKLFYLAAKAQMTDLGETEQAGTWRRR
jgi:hypothetical protein